MADPRPPLPSPSSPPNDSVPRRFKIIWRLLLISNLALSAYMFSSARKKGLARAENYRVEKVMGKLENDGMEKQSNSEVITEIPSTFMMDTTDIVTDNISEDQHRGKNHSSRWFMFGEKR